VVKVAILDDYQSVAARMADWSSLPHGTEVQIFADHLKDEDAVAARLQSFDVIVAMRERTAFRRSLLSRLQNLKLLITTGARNASIDVAAAVGRGVIVCGTRGMSTGTSELTWGLILSLARHIHEEDRAVHQGEWQRQIGPSLEGHTLGLVGLGNLGSRVAAVGKAFFMDVVAWSTNLTEERCREVGVRKVSKEELFSTADFVSVHLVLSDRSRGLVTKDDIARMKATAYLINTSRGPIVDEDALLAALQQHRIAGAALDVFSDEPLEPDSPWLKLDNLLITPHIGYVTEDNYRIYYGDALEDIQAFLQGQPVRVVAP
jgi:phosphoglycerate dehydrogenase-like enzyme